MIRAAFEYGTGQDLAELYTPLVERVDVPDSCLHKNLVLVECDQGAKSRWLQFLQQYRGAWSVAGMKSMEIVRLPTDHQR